MSPTAAPPPGPAASLDDPAASLDDPAASLDDPAASLDDPAASLDDPAASLDDLIDSHLVIVTGKGGVGKTTVAASLALAGVASGRRTLLVEVEGRQSNHRLFGTQPWDYDEREFRPRLHGASLDPAEAVYEYLEMFYGLRRVQWVMERSNAIDFVTAAAPGLRDLLLIGKVYEIEARRDQAGRRSYDLIVLDAPPTGRIVPFLQAPDGVTEIVRVGPIKRQAGQIRQMLTDERRTRAVVVSLLEEMPVQEAVEGIAQLRAAGIAIGPVVANMVEVPRLGRDQLDELTTDGPAGLVAATDGGLDEAAAADALELAAAHVERTAMQASLRDRLARRTGQPVLELPLLARPRFGADELEILADVLATQVGEDGPLAATVPGWLDRDRVAPAPRPADGGPS